MERKGCVKIGEVDNKDILICGGDDFPIVKYLIEGRKWFDKINGNTYHSVTITRITENENEIIAEIPMTYGYGDGYQQTAYDKLIQRGLVKEEDRFNHELNHKRFIYVVSDVSRKKDL